MTDVFVSYKREDVARVAKLVDALEGAGFSVWWDRELPSGEAWRTNVERALHSAKVVVVAWSQASIGPEGQFVRDEASRAGVRLLPILLDRVRPPLGFAEIQALDLVHWRGSQNDPSFQDLVATITARLSGKPAPSSKGPMRIALHRLVWSGGLLAILGAVVAFLWTSPTVRTQICRVPLAQPALSEACCEMGFTVKEIRRGGSFSPVPSLVMRGYLRQTEKPLPTVEEAEAEAKSRLSVDAANSCSGITSYQRLIGFEPSVQSTNCRQTAAGFVCSLDYSVRCDIEEQGFIEICLPSEPR